MIGTVATRLLKGSKLSHAIFELNTGQQTLACFNRYFAKHANGVFTDKVVTRMHQPVGQIAGSRKQEQSTGIEIETPDRNPAPAGHLRQGGKHRRTMTWVITRHDLAFRLVINNHPWQTIREF